MQPEEKVMQKVSIKNIALCDGKSFSLLLQARVEQPPALLFLFIETLRLKKASKTESNH